jgi:hypothetical protein
MMVMHLQTKYFKNIFRCKNLSQSHGTEWNDFYAITKNKHKNIKRRGSQGEPKVPLKKLNLLFTINSIVLFQHHGYYS